MSPGTPPTIAPVALRAFIEYRHTLLTTATDNGSPATSYDGDPTSHVFTNQKEQDQASRCGATVARDERGLRHDSTASTLVAEETNERPYSIFSNSQKKSIIIMASVAAFLSPLSSQIYLPATQKIALEYGVSSTKVNLTLTVFIVMQGIVPSFVAAFADSFGRRPVYLVCFPIYIAANIGLALQQQYEALVALRCLQGIGSSAMATLSSAVVADMITSAERGTYMGFTQVGSILGPAVGPVLGGVISQYTNWRYIFALLSVLSGVIFVPLALLLPETCRSIVGDGSLPVPVSNQSVLQFFRRRSEQKNMEETDKDADQESQMEHMESESADRVQFRKRSFNPLASLTIMFNIETAMLLFCNSVAFACFIAVTTSIPSLFHSLYRVNEMQTALIYIPLSLGTLLSAVSTGQLINWNFRRHALKHGIALTKNRQQDLSGFPVEKARLEIAWPLMLLAAASLTMYGWTMHLNSSIGAPVAILFVFGYTNVAAYKTTGI